jgi:MFS transporter, ACS family, glucarate transporter
MVDSLRVAVELVRRKASPEGSNLASLLVVRFRFRAGEAGAFPGMARVVYSWIPVKERGLVKGINFSGSRIGAALAMPGIARLESIERRTDARRRQTRRLGKRFSQMKAPH